MAIKNDDVSILRIQGTFGFSINVRKDIAKYSKMFAHPRVYKPGPRNHGS